MTYYIFSQDIHYLGKHMERFRLGSAERTHINGNVKVIPKAYVRSIHSQLSRSLGKRMEWIAIRDHDFDTQTLLDPN